jgi:Ca2+-binding RTX toxin-like protein
MNITLVDDVSVAGAPSGFTSALQTAANILDTVIKDPINIRIKIGYGEDNGTAITGSTLAEAGPDSGVFLTYNQLIADLTKAATSADDFTFLKGLLSVTDPTNGNSYYVSIAQEKAWGLVSPTASEDDASAGFSSNFNWDFDPSNGITASTYDLVGVALHELTHALGRTAPKNFFTPMDLMGYGSNGKLDPNNSDPRYFSIDGGKTNLIDFDATSDPGDFASGSPVDPFDAFLSSGVVYSWTALDSRLMDVLGYNVAPPGAPPTPPPPPPTPPPTPPPPPSPPPPPPPEPPPPPTPPVPTPPTPPVPTPPTPPTPPVPTPPTPTPGLGVLDTTTGQTVPAVAQPYTGPVAGLQEQYINISLDNLNITASTPNWFLHSGSGEDAIAVNSGTNVLDGGTGSNFLVGGSGSDTFFVDDRGPTADIWSTVVGFHTGDSATVWGVTPQDFRLAFVDGQGAAGFVGLTLHATAADKPTASLTLAGFTTADLSNGRVSFSFGTSGGSTYMNILDAK